MVETFSILLPRSAFQIHGVFFTHSLSQIQPNTYPVLLSSHMRLVAAPRMAQTSELYHPQGSMETSEDVLCPG